MIAATRAAQDSRPAVAGLEDVARREEAPAHHDSVMRILTVVCIGLLDLACVAKSQYQSLAAERDHVAQELAGARSAASRREAEEARALQTAQAALDHCSERVAALEADGRHHVEQIVSLEQRGLVLENDLNVLQGQLAQLVKDRSRLGASVAEMQRALASLLEREREARRRIDEYRDVVARFKDLIDAGKLQVRVVDGRMVLTLPMDILFASGSAKLSREGKDALSELGQRLAAMPSRRLQVEGHTDNVPIHTATYASNWELAAGRALVVVRALLEAGLPPERLSAASFGEHRPTAHNDTDGERAKNRRIELVLVPDLSLLPGYAELNQLAAGS